jgi:hypothetical protein
MAPKTTGATKTKSTTPRKKAGSTQKNEPQSVVRAKTHKSAINPGTWITLLLLAVIVGFAVYLKRGKEDTAEATPTSEQIAFVFPPAEGTASSIEIKPAEGDAVRIVRNTENAWMMELPLETEADPGLAEAAASQLSALDVVSPVEGDPKTFGLDTPDYVITVKFANGKSHTLEIGDSTPSNSGYYVRLDGDKMMITGLSGVDSLVQLTLFPPYLNTPTPTATLTATPIPPTETPVPPTVETTVTPTP